MSGEDRLKQIDPGTGLTLEDLIDAFITSPREAKALKIYLTRDKCPCCGTVLEGKSREWLAEFSQLVDDLGLPPWPGLAERCDAFTMMEGNARE